MFHQVGKTGLISRLSSTSPLHERADPYLGTEVILLEDHPKP
jgi:hypothetical protein